jgi:hypothetical protein
MNWRFGGIYRLYQDAHRTNWFKFNALHLKAGGFLVRISVGSPAILTEVFSCCSCCCEEYMLCIVLDAAIFILPSRILGFHLPHNLGPSCRSVRTRDSQFKCNLSWNSQALAVRWSLQATKFRYQLKCETPSFSVTRNVYKILLFSYAYFFSFFSLFSPTLLPTHLSSFRKMRGNLGQASQYGNLSL